MAIGDVYRKIAGTWVYQGNIRGAPGPTGDLGDLWFEDGLYIDLSVEANLRKFIGAYGNPVDLGADGSTPNTTAPIVYLGRDIATFHTNLGTGGGFTLVGTAPTETVVAGAAKCFNTRKTCQDSANFTNDPVTLRFAKRTAYLPAEFEAIPNIESVEYSPGIISLGENLGQRSSLKVTFKDHPWSDTGPGFDPYLADRAYNPWDQGTFWGKMRARQPYVQGRAQRWLDMTLGQTLAEADTRHFVMESFNGPSPAGRYDLISKDILKLADNDRAKAPALSNGRLAADLTTTSTSAILTPTGIGDLEYATSGYLNFGGKEIVKFTRSGDNLTIAGTGSTGRAQLGTTAFAHDAQDRVQTVLREESQDPADILYRLATTYAGISVSASELAAWQAETGANYRRLMTGTVAEPTGVNKLMSEIIRQAALAMWDDPLEQQIRLQVLKAIATDAETFTPSNTIGGSLTIKEQPDKRWSRVHVYYGQRNPLDPQDEPTNYRASWASVATDAERDHGAKSVLTIFSRWIPAGGSSTAERLGSILLAQYKDPPRRFGFAVARHSAETPTLGEGVRLQAPMLQDATGAAASVPVQITQLKTTPARYIVEAEESNFGSIDEEDLSHRQVIISASENGISTLRARHDEAYPVPVAGDSVEFIVESWVVLGALSTSTYALDTGNWPSVAGSGTRTNTSPIITGLADTSTFGVGMGVTGTGIPAGAKILTVDSATQITLDKNATSGGTSTVTVWTVILTLRVRGQVEGAGGAGGQGASYGPARNPTSGSAGGPALKVRAPLNLILNEGLGRLFGGGGGGGGADVLNLDEHRGGGGGGGAGIPGGLGGDGLGNGQDGAPGTASGGGAGGISWASYSWSQWPYYTGVTGGNGGGPGLPGATGGHHGGSAGERQPGAGGAAGPAIVGIDFVSKTGTGDIRGGQIN